MSYLLEIATVVSFVTFLGIVWWAMSKHQKQRFDDAANLPFALPDEQNFANRSKP